MKRILYCYLLLCLSLGTYGQSIARIDSLVELKISEDGIPALAISIIESGEVTHMKTYGYADLEEKKLATKKTSFHIASVSKTITSLAVFQLVEKGEIDLNTDINEYLDFEVQNPHYPSSIITVGELLNHKSGLRDSQVLSKDYWSVSDGDPKEELRDFLYSYLNNQGKLYKKKNFGKDENYKTPKYCNIGYALLGLIVEQVSGEDFSTYCKQSIFSKLEMENTGWFLNDLEIKTVAKTYSKDKSGNFVFKGHNGYPDYPAGLLRTSIQDFSKLIKGYLTKEDFVVQEETLKAITPDFDQKKNRFTWFPITVNDNNYYTHGGGDPGVRTMVIMDVERNNAIIIFANAVYNQEEFIKTLEQSAFRN